MAGRKRKKADKGTTTSMDYDLVAPPENLNCRQKGVYYESLFKTDYIKLAERLVGAGFTEKDLAYTFGVPKGAIDSWKLHHSQFKKACEEGRRRVKHRMVAKAIMSAMGYDYSSSKTKTIIDKEGNIQKTEVTEFQNHQPPNHNLLMFILCNLDRQLGDGEWFSKHKLEIENNKNINLQITGELATEQITKLAGKLLEEPKRKQIESKQIN